MISYPAALKSAVIYHLEAQGDAFLPFFLFLMCVERPSLSCYMTNELGKGTVGQLG